MCISLVLLAAVVAYGVNGQAADMKPNFIFIFIDDLGYGDIGPFGSKVNRTPNLDRMASEGMKLTSFYAAPVCTPSRAQVITGCYAKRISMPHVIFPGCPTGLNAAEHTIAELVQAQGYATMCIGKWHLGDHAEFLPTRHGFDHYFGIPYSNDMGGGRRADRPPLPLVRDEMVIETLEPSEKQDPITARYADEAVKFIRTNRARPFFLYFPQTAVHTPLHPGEEFRDKSKNGPFGDWVEEVDWSVGRILDTLRELTLDRNTLVVFSSDNGPWLIQGKHGGTAGPLRGGKGGTYEGGVRVPTLAWWPGRVAPGTTCDAAAANFDLLPTFVHLAGGKLPADRPIDGRDISPLLLGKTKTSPHEAIYYFAGNTIQAVRSGPWKLAVARQNEARARSAQPDAKKPFTPTLYNLDSDIGEQNDVAAKHPDVVERLKGLIATMDADLGASKIGPGVRPCGDVGKHPGLWLGGKPPADAATAPGADKPLGELKLGTVLTGDAAPRVAGRPFSISCELEPKTPNGIVVAHGGNTVGYAIYLKDGKVGFAVRTARETVTHITAGKAAGRFRVEARLGKDGAMTLAINGEPAAAGKAPSLIPRQPAEDFCVGHDSRMPVADYGGAGKFDGRIDDLRIGF